MSLPVQAHDISAISEFLKPFDHTTLVWGTQIVAAALGWCASRMFLGDRRRNGRPSPGSFRAHQIRTEQAQNVNTSEAVENAGYYGRSI